MPNGATPNSRDTEGSPTQLPSPSRFSRGKRTEGSPTQLPSPTRFSPGKRTEGSLSQLPSPSRSSTGKRTDGKRTRISDRFIPCRDGANLQMAFALLKNPNVENVLPAVENGTGGQSREDAASHSATYNTLLKNELLDGCVQASEDPTPRATNIIDGARTRRGSRSKTGSVVGPGEPNGPTRNPWGRLRDTRYDHYDAVYRGNIFRFQSPPRSPDGADGAGGGGCGSPGGGGAGIFSSGGAVNQPSPFHRSPLGANEAQRSLLTNRNSTGNSSRRISKSPFKILDAPNLEDDFYLNLVDWSSQNLLAVGLGSSVYLWSAYTSQVTKLSDDGLNGSICSVSWSQNGRELAVGTSTGILQIWDGETCNKMRTITGHTQRVGALAWNSNLLSSGSRDLSILNRDPRAPDEYVSVFKGHRQEICGLRWSFDDQQLASGGNDNRLLIWSAPRASSSASSSRHGGGGGSDGGGEAVPQFRFSDHVAAVKAIAWSPHARGLLASGGGTQDQRIRFWNTISGQPLREIETGSQVCNLAWSKNVNELVSTHGYSQNHVIVWRYPTLSRVVTLTGHKTRVLYLAVNPTGETIVTGAGDQSLRFWNVFPGPSSPGGLTDQASALNAKRMSIR